MQTDTKRDDKKERTHLCIMSIIPFYSNALYFLVALKAEKNEAAAEDTNERVDSDCFSV